MILIPRTIDMSFLFFIIIIIIISILNFTLSIAQTTQDGVNCDT